MRMFSWTGFRAGILVEYGGAASVRLLKMDAGKCVEKVRLVCWQPSDMTGDETGAGDCLDMISASAPRADASGAGRTSASIARGRRPPVAAPPLPPPTQIHLSGVSRRIAPSGASVM